MGEAGVGQSGWMEGKGRGRVSKARGKARGVRRKGGSRTPWLGSRTWGPGPWARAQTRKQRYTTIRIVSKYIAPKEQLFLEKNCL